MSLYTELKQKQQDYWLKEGERMALKLFFEMHEHVPAYKNFIKEHNINAKKILSIDDFKKIPPISKKNYLKKYSPDQLGWKSGYNRIPQIYASTSGTTGNPYYFPRTLTQITQYALLADLYLRDNFQIEEKKTLYVNCFALGVWIGGLFTHEAITYLQNTKKYYLDIISTGINIKQILNSIKNVGASYDQVILAGYPPFIKDVIDSGNQVGMNWSQYNLGIIFSAESFSEAFRDYIIKKGSIQNLYKGTLNHYGTVDLGTMAYETPLSILIRRSAMSNNALYERIFGKINKIPTLTQYIPSQFFFESIEGNLVCSAYSGLPLTRYSLGDHGKVVNFSEVVECFASEGLDLHRMCYQNNIQMWQLPFVYVYEREDLSTTLYGLNIYPETIKKVLLLDELQEYVTGKFTMTTKYDTKEDQYLEINIEMRKNKEPSNEIKQLLEQNVINSLATDISEYAELSTQLPERSKPHIVLYAYNDNTFFESTMAKQKWVIK